MKSLFGLLITLLLSNFIYSQEKNDWEIVKKPIKNDSIIIGSNASNNDIKNILKNKNYNSKIFVSIDNKFYSSDTLSKIKNLDDYEMDVINIPEKITKDIRSILVLKKVVK